MIGVFIGIQVANWNEARATQLSESQYLNRVSDEMSLTLEQIEHEHAFSLAALHTIETFTSQLFDDSIPDETLIETTRKFFSDGAFFAKFSPYRTTFDDLVSTGNLGIITDESLRRSLVTLHASFDDADLTIRSNIDWINQGEDRIYYEFDAFLFDARTDVLFGDVNPEQLASDIRTQRELLRRHAAFHYWLKTRSNELYEELTPKVRAMLEQLEADKTSS